MIFFFFFFLNSVLKSLKHICGLAHPVGNVNTILNGYLLQTITKRPSGSRLGRLGLPITAIKLNNHN